MIRKPQSPRWGLWLFVYIVVAFGFPFRRIVSKSCEIQESDVRRMTHSFGNGFSEGKNTLEKMSFLLFRFLWTSKENEKIYFYDATGVKQKKIVSGGATTEYAGNYVYENSSLIFFNHAEGYVEPNGSNWDYIYQYKDHLGNIRLAYHNSGTAASPTLQIREENNYYPFGLKHRGYNGSQSAARNHKYGFGGKEEQDDAVGGSSLNWLDFGARNYDAALGRWMNLDPLAEQMRRHSPYNYAFDNPVFFIDPDGMMPLGIGGLDDSDNFDKLDKPSLDNEFSRRMNAKSQEDFGNGYKPLYKAGRETGNGDSNSSSSSGDGNCCGNSSDGIYHNVDGTTTIVTNGIAMTYNLTGTNSNLRDDSKTAISIVGRGFSLGAMGASFYSKDIAKIGEVAIGSLGRITGYSKASMAITGKLSGYARLFARKAGALSIGFNMIDYSEGRISGYELGTNSGWTSYGLYGGPIGWFLSGSVFLFDVSGGKAIMEKRAENIHRDIKKGMGPHEAIEKYSCFVKGTKVLMADLTEKNIESIKLGDVILSVNIHTMRFEEDTVIEIPEVNKEYKIIKVEFANGTTNEFSPAHPYWVIGKGWSVFDLEEAKTELTFSVSQLEVGDKVLFYKKGKLKQTKIISLTDSEIFVEMYNVEHVKKNNTFFANKILVHNKRIN